MYLWKRGRPYRGQMWTSYIIHLLFKKKIICIPEMWRFLRHSRAWVCSAEYCLHQQPKDVPSLKSFSEIRALQPAICKTQRSTTFCWAPEPCCKVVHIEDIPWQFEVFLGITPNIVESHVLLPVSLFFWVRGTWVANWTRHLFRAKLWINENNHSDLRKVSSYVLANKANLWISQCQDVSRIVCPSAGHGNEIGTKCHCRLAWTAKMQTVWKKTWNFGKVEKYFLHFVGRTAVPPQSRSAGVSTQSPMLEPERSSWIKSASSFNYIAFIR